jgi:hypothetical protein
LNKIEYNFCKNPFVSKIAKGFFYAVTVFLIQKKIKITVLLIQEIEKITVLLVQEIRKITVLLEQM